MDSITRVLDTLDDCRHTKAAREALEQRPLTQEGFDLIWATLDHTSRDEVGDEIWDDMCLCMANLAEEFGLVDTPAAGKEAGEENDYLCFIK